MAYLPYGRMPRLAIALEGMLRGVAMTRCAGCGRWNQAGFCLLCQARVQEVPEVAIGAYQGELRTAIHRMKFCGRPDVALDLGEMLSHRIREQGILVPIPLSPEKRKTRGYNQAELLALAVARHLKLSVAPHLLMCQNQSAPQHKLDRAGRLQNARDAYWAPVSLHGETVILVDDVRTTGATLESARRALEAAGAARILTAVAAVTLLRG